MNKGKFTDLLLDAWIFFPGVLPHRKAPAAAVKRLKVFHVLWYIRDLHRAGEGKEKGINVIIVHDLAFPLGWIYPRAQR